MDQLEQKRKYYRLLRKTLRKEDRKIWRTVEQDPTIHYVVSEQWTTALEEFAEKKGTIHLERALKKWTSLREDNAHFFEEADPNTIEGWYESSTPQLKADMIEIQFIKDLRILSQYEDWEDSR